MPPILKDMQTLFSLLPPNSLLRCKKRLLGLFVAFLFLFLCDRLTKIYFTTHLQGAMSYSPLYPYGGVPVFENLFGIDFCLHWVSNLGGAWGLFAHTPSFLRTVRLLLGLALLLYFLALNQSRSKDLSLLLLLSGAWGNLYDTYVIGYVIDFLHFTLWKYSFPVFNIADTWIFLGVTSFFIQSLRKQHDTVSLSHSPS